MRGVNYFGAGDWDVVVNFGLMRRAVRVNLLTNIAGRTTCTVRQCPGAAGGIAGVAGGIAGAAGGIAGAAGALHGDLGGIARAAGGIALEQPEAALEQPEALPVQPEAQRLPRRATCSRRLNVEFSSSSSSGSQLASKIMNCHVGTTLTWTLPFEAGHNFVSVNCAVWDPNCATRLTFGRTGSGKNKRRITVRSRR